MEAIDINDTFGAMLVGALVTMVTYGITTLQAYFYFMTYPQDSPGIKSFVGLIWCARMPALLLMSLCCSLQDIGHSPRRIHVPCNPLVSNRWIRKSHPFSRRNMVSLLLHNDQCYNSIFGAMLLRSTNTWIMSQTVQVVDDFRYRRDGLRPFLFRPRNCRSIKEFSRLNEVNFVAVLPFGITAILSDILIAVGLCLLLERSRTDFANTNYLIKTLIGYAITRCLLTSLMAIVEVIVFVTKPTSFYSFAIDFVIGKLWSNSLLASLNSRRSLRDTFNRKDSGTMSTGFRVASPGLSTTGAEPGQFNLVRIPRHDESKSTDEEIGSCTKISTQ
ncbi:hypothetical protein F5146DRAFT_400262 [Armillaria mellea]|nr:hypothetical protein F5146DRAFT_400262 [Armillaria mellea]